MRTPRVRATRDALDEFKESIIWKDFKRELAAWKLGFQREMMGIVGNAESEKPSTAEVLMHLGDLHGRMKAVDYLLQLPDMFKQILEEQKDERITDSE